MCVLKMLSRCLLWPIRLGIVCGWIVLTSAQAGELDDIKQRVLELPCSEGLNVEQRLDDSIKSRSQRDLGWRIFQEDDYVDVERAVKINKAMELRYRWRVFTDGSIKPQSGRAERLCDDQ